MSSPKIELILSRFDVAHNVKNQWTSIWTDIARYIHMRKYNFNVKNPAEGMVLNRQVFDSTAPKAMTSFVSAFLGALWPSGVKTFKLTRPFDIPETEEVKDYYEWATAMLTRFMDRPEAGLNTSLHEYMLDQASFGTSGVGMFENPGNYMVPFYCRSFDIRVSSILEGRNGYVDTVYILEEKTVRQAVMEFGIDAMSEKIRDKYNQNKFTDKVEILWAIEPRDPLERNPDMSGVRNMPYASYHIEREAKHIIRESGFDGMPIFFTRFSKAIGETYGRSPGMDALPDIWQINGMSEALNLATEQSLDPTLMIRDGALVGNGKVLNTSPGGIVVVSASGPFANVRPIEPLQDGKELQAPMLLKQELKQSIREAFFLDRLLDFMADSQRSTATEANIRNGLRGESLSPMYARQLVELFTPLITRAADICFRAGLLGVTEGSAAEAKLTQMGAPVRYLPGPVAQAIAEGRDVYDIEFVSPAKRIMDSEQLSGIFSTLQEATVIAGIKPEALDFLNADEALREVVRLSGAPSVLRVAEDKVSEIREARAKMQQQQMQISAQEQQSKAVLNQANANAAMINASKPNGLVNR